MSALSKSYAARHPAKHARAMEKAAAHRAAMAAAQKRASRIRNAMGFLSICACTAFLVCFVDFILSPLFGMAMPSAFGPLFSGLIAVASGAAFDHAHTL